MSVSLDEPDCNALETAAGNRRILAIDAAGSGCSVAVLADGKILFDERVAMRRGQSEALVPLAREAMRQAGLAWQALDSLAVTSGPGSFTGVRIGLAAAQGLALAWDLPVVAVTAFEAMAAAVTAEERGARPLVVLIESKRAEVYVQVFPAADEAAGDPRLIDEAGLVRILPPGPLLLAGDAAADWTQRLTQAGLSPTLSRACPHVSAARIAYLAAAKPRPPRPWPLVEPLYLRQADTTKAKAFRTAG